MVAAATKGLMPELMQMRFVSDAGFTGIGSKISTIKDKHPPRTANHKTANKATTQGYILRMARVRKKKRREVNTTVAQKKTTTNLPSMIHIEFESIAEEKSEVGYAVASELTCKSYYHSRYSKP